MPEYDPLITTHIIAETDRHLTLVGLKLKSLRRIPQHILLVTWGWVSSNIDVLSSWKSRSEEDIQRSLFNTAIYYTAKFDPRPLPPPLPSQNPGMTKKAKARTCNLSSTNEYVLRSFSCFLSCLCSYAHVAVAFRLVPSLDLGPPSQATRTDSAATRSDQRLGHGARGTSPSSPRDVGPPGELLSGTAAIASSSRNPGVVVPARLSGEKETDPLAEFYSRARADKRKEEGVRSLSAHTLHAL